MKKELNKILNRLEDPEYVQQINLAQYSLEVLSMTQLAIFIASAEVLDTGTIVRVEKTFHTYLS